MRGQRARQSAGPFKQTSLEADFTRLIAMHEAGKLDRAIVKAKKLSKIYPDQPLPHNVLGAIYMTRLQYEKAAKCFRKAIQIAPDFTDAINNLGAAYNSLEAHEKAIECYQKVIANNPRDPEAYANMGNALRRADRSNEAVRAYQQSLQLRPADPPTQLSLAHSLKDCKQFQEANTEFRCVMEAAPSSDTAECIGDTCRDIAQPEEAVRWYLNALDLHPQDPAALFRLGRKLLQMAENSHAIVALERSLELQPEQENAKHFLTAARKQTSDLAPEGYVAEMFDEYAATFENHLIDSLAYDAPARLRTLLDDSIQGGKKVELAMDLGCGTGLGGAAFRELCSKLYGVDLSANMIAQAREKQIYDKLLEGSLISTVDELGQLFDLFIATDTLIYLGDFAPLFTTLAAHANDGALLAFTTESLNAADYELQTTGRYAHSKDYVTRTAVAAGFELIAFQEMSVREEAGVAIAGGYYLFRYSR